MFRHAVILGPALGGPPKTDEVVATARLLAALKGADVRTTLITSVDAAAPMGALAADETIVAAYDASSAVDELDRIGPDSLFWIPGGAHARDVVSAIEQSGVFQESSISLSPRPERLRRLEDPDLLAQIVRPLGLTVPSHRVIADASQLRVALKALGLPCSLRPLQQTAAAYQPLRDEHDVLAACDSIENHRHWMVRQTAQRGLLVDVIVAADEGGRTSAVAVVRHCEPWLADCGASTLYSSRELSERPDVARLAEHAEQVAAVLQMSGLLTVRLSADVDTESCAVLDVFAAAGPSCWLAEIATGLALYDLGVSLQLGRTLSTLPTGQPSTVVEPCLLALPRVTHAAAGCCSAEYSWFSGASPRGALETALASVGEHQLSGARHAQPSRPDGHRRLIGIERWASALTAMAAGATPEEAGEALSLAPDLKDAFLAADRSTHSCDDRPTPSDRPTSAGARGERFAMLTAPRALLGVDELWAASQAAATLCGAGNVPILATSSLPLAALLRPLDIQLWSTAPAHNLTSRAEDMALEVALVFPSRDQALGDVLTAYGLSHVHLAGAGPESLRRPAAERPRGSPDLSSVSQLVRRRATNVDDARGLADQHGWPVHACHGPGGAAGEAVLLCAEALQRYCRSVAVSPERPVFLASVPRDARVLDVELLCRAGRIVLMAWSESLQSLEAHSNMALDVMPPQRTYPELLRRGRALVTQIATLLEADGPLSVRLLVTEQEVRLLTTTAGSPRQWSRMSRTLGVDWAGAWAELATRGEGAFVRCGRDIEQVSLSLRRGVPHDQTAGRGTSLDGSMTMLGDDPDHLLLGVLRASGLKQTVRTAWLSATSAEDRIRLIHSARLLKTAGVRLYATEASAACLRMNDVEVTTLAADDSRLTPAQLRRRIDLLVAVTDPSAGPGEAAGVLRWAQMTAIPVIEDLHLLQRLAGALVRHPPAPGAVRSWSEHPRQVVQWA